MKHEPTSAFRPARQIIRQPHVVIVGAGLAGVATAISILSKTAAPLELLLVEPANPIGVGRAYANASEHAVLEAFPETLSLFPDRPRDFASWAASSPRGAAGLTRATYAAYVKRRLRDAIDRAPQIDVGSTRDRALDVQTTPHGLTVRLRNGGPIRADAVVLAIGGAPSLHTSSDADLVLDDRGPAPFIAGNGIATTVRRSHAIADAVLGRLWAHPLTAADASSAIAFRLAS